MQLVVWERDTHSEAYQPEAHTAHSFAPSPGLNELPDLHQSYGRQLGLALVLETAGVLALVSTFVNGVVMFSFSVCLKSASGLLRSGCNFLLFFLVLKVCVIFEEKL